MDIIVTCPKDQADHFWEKREFEVAFWNFSKLPKQVMPGEFIYFVLKGICCAKAKILSLSDRDEEECGITGKSWDGAKVYWKSSEFSRLKRKIKIKGFRNFRYIRDSLGAFSQ